MEGAPREDLRKEVASLPLSAMIRMPALQERFLRPFCNRTNCREAGSRLCYSFLVRKDDDGLDYRNTAGH